MTASSTCFACGRALSLVPEDEIARARESLGFGAANDRLREFCGLRCRARWRHVDPVLEETRQTRLEAWTAGGIDLESPGAIIYGR
ncbi:hypothetical protein [Natronosalvus caseinilyticus]|uniref:hypothetical protein n=1 Tax=Natronosalvus caseinilyticus TaxID=2953747 RepID=UPI0028AEB986|nr:hypothetical protein [Natronosalvus caseinilyticus]